MLVLALSNLTCRKVRSGLSILAVAIAITLLLVLLGLSRGTLNEVSRRIESVDAEIIVRDKYFDLGSLSGGKLWEKEVHQIQAVTLPTGQAVERVIPVFLGRMKLAGLNQNVFGVHPDEFRYFAGSRRLIQGRLFTDVDSPQDALKAVEPTENTNPDSATTLELVIDQRLARAANASVGDQCTYGDCPARIVGIVETGVAGRVFAPINMLRGANGVASATAHMFFVKAQPGLNTDQLQQLCDAIETDTHRAATLVANYGQVLEENYHTLTLFVNLVSVIALVICFLFIVVTMYTIVLERGKEIAILRSLGASRRMVLRQTMQESLLICSMGTAAGMGLAWLSRYFIQTFQPLMNIEMRPDWFALAAVIGIGGGVFSALYPSWLALQHDPVEALSFE